jgi:hypothetical protein
MSSSTFDISDPKHNGVKLTAGICCSVVFSIAAYMLLPDFIPFKMEIVGILMCVSMMISCILWTRKSKVVVAFLTFIPVIPADRIYMGDGLDLDDPTSLLIRAIPLIGGFYDLWLIFISKSLKPSGGWSETGF